MHIRAQHFKKPDSAVQHPEQHHPISFGATSAVELPTTQRGFWAEDWLADCQIRQQSERTIELRKMLIGRLQWFLSHRQLVVCGTSELRAFFAYLTTAHNNDAGRWGYGHEHRAKEPLRPATVRTYYAHLRSFFNWLVSEEMIATSPLAALKPPQSRPDQIQPFTPEQVEALLQAARRASYPQRDEVIVLFLLDTGVRASGLCTIRMKDVDLFSCHVQVLGKGNKKRSVYFGRRCARSLRTYLRREYRTTDCSLFTTERGESALTRSGLLQIIQKTGKRAGIQVTRCSPHTFRNTFAVEFLRAGGNVFSLQQLLGHTGLQVTQRYVSLAQADIQTQHRQFSPGDRLR